MSCTRIHYTVVRNGKLTRRIKCIVDHYRKLGVDVESVLEQELEHLKEQSLLKEVFGRGSVDLVPKVRALEDILSVLNS